jgi:hypothetical protein
MSQLVYVDNLRCTNHLLAPREASPTGIKVRKMEKEANLR